jgi:hypothetical protein
MNIEELLRKMHDSDNKDFFVKEIKEQFDKLSDIEKEEVRKFFLKNLDNQLTEASETLNRVDLYIEMNEDVSNKLNETSLKIA